MFFGGFVLFVCLFVVLFGFVFVFFFWLLFLLFVWVLFGFFFLVVVFCSELHMFNICSCKVATVRTVEYQAVFLFY